MLYAIPFPQIDPILLSLGPFDVRWYALAYILGLVIGWRLLRRLAEKSPFDIDQASIDDFLIWATIGVIIGGRIGYVLLYHLYYFVSNPEKIFFVWQGGMSFHGGLLGVAVAGVLFCKRRGIQTLKLGDLLACTAPIGLFFGRVANFFNGELFGRPTDVPWSVIFPRGGPYPRHPSQLYEAALEGVLLFVVLNLLLRVPSIRDRRGFLTGTFLAGYAVSRIIAEMFRQPDAHIGFLQLGLTMGQWLSVPMLFIGLYMVWRTQRVPSS
ncbi:MAG: prolipoprotein diacylglyceryl transferase [Rhodospirillaceae bacterium TMED8]|nr:prolipoprotein diacylglyceryl transferase [Magnetovibrio sp.]OUT47719.1 MAG: prolipoprotein diacylglyceryl transferase [Rhodospirillaceae bacterium TMED8]|tara:strand:+ start:181 stop:981 length:801 start_codon:yes stop_codon:yes gene_type:complete